MPIAFGRPGKQDWTADDLPGLPVDLRYELIDGRLVVLNYTGMHQAFCFEIVLMIRPNCPPGYVAVPQISLAVDQQNELRPDIVVGRRSDGMRSPVPVESVLLVADVISSTSHFRDLHAKMQMFATAGVGSYWVIEPTFEKGVVLTEFRLGEDGRYLNTTTTDGIFTTDAPFPATIDLPALTALRNEYREAQNEA